MSEHTRDLAQYVCVPEGHLAKYESHKGMMWLPVQREDWKQGAHALLKQEGLEMPMPAVFMSYVKRVIAAHNGKEKLYDGLGNEIASQEREDLYLHLTTNHITGGAWSWLNARFVAHEQGFQGFGLERVVDVRDDGALVTKTEPLLQCVGEDGYVTLDFNAQGLPTKLSEVQKYMQGENVLFWFPRRGSVAWFLADSDGAVLDCDWDPASSNSVLGVFAFAREKKLKVIQNTGKYLETIARDERAITIDEEGVQVELLQRSATVSAFEKSIETLPREQQEIVRRGFYYSIGKRKEE